MSEQNELDSDFFRKDPVFKYFGGRRSAKTRSERLDGMRGTFFRIYSGFCRNFSAANAQTWIFRKNSKCIGKFLSFSFDSLLSRGSRDVFTGFLARSVQELGLIIGLPPAGAGFKGNTLNRLLAGSRHKIDENLTKSDSKYEKNVS